MTVTESPSTATPQSEDLLRLTNCPQCEYSLHGLPDEGVCPECGFAYDRSVVILRCHGPGAYRLHSHVLLGLAMLLAVGLLAVTMLRPDIWTHATQLMLMLAFFSLVLGLTWLDRVTSPRAGVWLLWMTPKGIGVQTNLDPASMLARVQRWLPLVWMPMYVSAGFVAMAFTSPWPLTMVVTAFVFGGGMFWFQHAIQVKPAIAAAGAQPALFGWHSVSRITLRQAKGGRYRLLVTNSSWVSKNRPIVNVNFEGTEELAAQVRGEITKLGGVKVTE